MIEIDGLFLYIFIDVFCLFLLTGLYHQLVYTQDDIIHKNYFKRCLFYSYLFIFSDILLYTSYYEIGSYSIIFNICYIIYFAVFSCSGYNFFLYFSKLIGYDKLDCIKTRLIFLYPLIISAFLDIIGFTNIIKIVFTVLYALIYIIYTLLMIYNIKENKFYNDRIKFIELPLVPFLISILHIFFPSIPVSIAITGSILIAYQYLLRLLISTDSLTQINNRTNLENYFNKIIKNNTSSNNIFLFIIDANDFKTINDTYGHIEGDKCLIRIAETMREICKPIYNNSYICRYGGDEFILIINNLYATPSVIENTIHNTLIKNNKMDEIEYEFSVCIGCAEYNNHDDLKNFIDDADKNLYTKKKIRKKEKINH